jgi:hypothetical protein
MSNNITLAQVAAMADDAYINDPVHCILQVTAQKTSKAGKPFWPCSLTDANDPSSPVLTTTFFADPSRYSGKLVSIEGKGNKKTSYNGKAQINMGKTAFVKVLGDAGNSAPVPAQTTMQRLTPTPAATSRPAFSADGAKIGGCVARAGEYITASNVELTEDEVVRVAGIFLRATTRLEQGEWAQQATQPVRRPQAGLGGSAFPPPQEIIDEDAPFN